MITIQFLNCTNLQRIEHIYIFNSKIRFNKNYKKVNFSKKKELFEDLFIELKILKMLILKFKKIKLNKNILSCRSSNVIKCCPEKCTSSLDLAIVMDSSGSIGQADFLVQKQFVKKLLEGLNLGRDATRVALINYNTKANLLIDFNSFVDYRTTAQIIDNIRYDGGLTFTDLALKMANDHVMQAVNGMREVFGGPPKVILTITDGASSNPNSTVKEIERIKRREFISMISVGIGVEIDFDELIALASTPDDQYLVEDFNSLANILIGSMNTKN